MRKGKKERKPRGVKTFSELVRPLTSAYVYLSGHRARAHPASSAAIKPPFPTFKSPSTISIKDRMGVDRIRVWSE